MADVPRRRKPPTRSNVDERFHASLDDSSTPEGNIFAWTILILALLAFAIFCWIGSFYVFGHPEKPLSYNILTKLKKLDPPKRFELTAAPRGEFLRAKQIEERYSKMTPRELSKVNETLLRNYLRNYKLTTELVPYVVGTFNILDSFELTPKDFFPSGVVALAQSRENPNVLLEQIFTAEERVVPALHRTLLTGLDIDLKRENELAALIHVERLNDGRIRATAISLLYPSYDSVMSTGTFTLDPPGLVNVSAGLPAVTLGRVAEADQKHARYRAKAGLPANAVAEDGPPQNRLMRVERPVAVNLPVQPEVPSATPVDAAPVEVAATPPPLVTAVPEPSPVETAPPTPSPSPTPAAIVASTGGSWPVYAPGQMPRGRLLGIKETVDIAGIDVSTERAYLQGRFVVTASGPNRAVLRNQGAIADSLGLGGKTSNVRIIVEFPAGSRPPAEGSTFSRDARRPFQITEVRRGSADGQVNVYVREVTRP